MLQPHFTLTITAGVVAWYAATLSTMTTAVQIAHFLRDRVRVKVTVQQNMETFGDPAHEGMTLTIVTVTNEGRRPVTIRGIGLMQLRRDKGGVFPDTAPQMSCELTEGKFATAFVDQTQLPLLEDIAYFQAWDATGRTYRANIAAWPKQIYWRMRRRWSRRREKQA